MTRGPEVQAAFARVIVDEFARAGVTDAFVSPGSRSTPVLLALADDRRISMHPVLDERSAAFRALGFGKAAGRPALVVTTSGTAAVEVHPAVVESDLASVPLLVVTADRPTELHDVGAAQTISQKSLFGTSLRSELALGVPATSSAWSWRSVASRAVADCTGLPAGPGPVHLNLELDEPLIAGEPSAVLALVPAGRPTGEPWHKVATPRPVMGTALPGSIPLPEKGLIVAGAGCGEPAAVLDLAETLGWPVLAEPCSGTRVPSPMVIAAADSALRTPLVRSWEPEAVFRLGRPWASRVVNEWLAALGPGCLQVLVDQYGRWPDPGRASAEVLRADSTAVCRALAAQGMQELAGRRPPTLWSRRWSGAEKVSQRAIAAQLGAGGACSEPGLVRHLVGSLPAGSRLLVSSSMPVRDVEWFGEPRSGLEVLSNRGANGIDGAVSTTLGVAAFPTERTEGVTVGLVGDLAFFYDASSLANVEPPAGEGRCIIVVLDNNGGNIFDFLPAAAVIDPSTYERIWVAPTNLDPAGVALAYGLDVAEVDSSSRLDALLDDASFGRAAPAVAVVRTDRAETVELHRRVNSAVASALGHMRP